MSKGALRRHARPRILDEGCVLFDVDEAARSCPTINVRRLFADFFPHGMKAIPMRAETGRSAAT